jgi:hypothetical protein
MKAIMIGIVMTVMLAMGFAVGYAVTSPPTQNNPQLQVPLVTAESASINGGSYENNSAVCAGVYQTVAPLPVDNSMAGMLRFLGYDYR